VSNLKLFSPEDIKNIDREFYKRSYYEFFKKAMKVLEPETDWDFNWHIEYICDILQEEVFRIRDKKPKTQDLVVNVPPGSSKSSIFSVCLTGWAWLHCPYLRIASNSFNAGLSTDHTKKSRDLIKSNWYQDLWGNLFELKEDNDRKTEFENNLGGVRKSAAETGRHFDIIIGDDLLNPKLASSEVERENANNLWFKTIPSRFKNLKTGLKIIVMQRLHESDTCGKIKEKGLNYRWVVIPAELQDNLCPKELSVNYKDGLFWTERYPKEILEEKKRELSPREYAGQYLQKPAPDDGIIFKKDWFGRFKPTDLPENITKQFYTDSANGTEKSDNTATICWSLFKGNVYIWAVEAVKKPLPEWCDWYVNFTKLLGATNNSYHFVENKANGFAIEQTLRQATNLNILLDKTPPDQSKIMRAETSAITARAGRVYLLENAHWIDDFLYELAVFPAGKFDDRVDCFSGLIRNSDLDYTETLENEEVVVF